MIELSGQNLTLDEVEDIVFGNARVSASPDALKVVKASADFVAKIVESDKAVYGVNTGFGKLSHVHISRDELKQLQLNIIRSHAAGVGDPIDLYASRAALLFRINSLLVGHSGVRPILIDYLINFLNEGVFPLIPSQGSVGSSGDLAPLSHMALLLVGEGEAILNDDYYSGAELLKKLGLKPLELAPKEGLALINGTQISLAVGWLAWRVAQNLVKHAIAIAAMSVEAACGLTSPFDERISRSHPHPGQIEVAEAVREWLSDSKLTNHAHDVQDPYSLRCIPQVLGSCWDSIRSVAKTMEIEMNSTTDNPLIFPETEEAISGGNFHGEVLGLAFERLGIAIAEIGAFSERRSALLLEWPDLPDFLVEDRGLNSGLMIAQYTAASLVSENKIYAHPAVVDSIPTSAGKEDHNSLGSIAAAKALRISRNVEYVLAIELLISAQALGFRDMEKVSSSTKQIYEAFRDSVPHLTIDRQINHDIIQAREMIRNNDLFRD